MDTPPRPEVLQIVDRCEALFEDLHFDAVKRWKDGAPGRKAIGYMPIYVPREIIHAAGMLPVGVLWGFRPAAELLESGARHLLKDPPDLLALLDP